MSILIKGASSLKEGLYQVQDGKIHAYKGNGGKTEGYDLIEVPTPHGRLIDADKLYEVISLNYKDLDSTEDFIGIGYDYCIGDTLIVIRQASTIIEAEEERG